MEIISKADVVLALGTRLNPFSTLPGYGIDYWPKQASIIQVDINSDRIGLAKKVSVGICGDAKLVAQQILSQLSSNAGDAGREDRKALFIKLNLLGCKHLQAWIMKKMIQVLPGIKIQEKEIQIECLHVWLGELFKQDFQKM